MYNIEQLEQYTDSFNINLSDIQKEQFIKYYEFLIEKNKVMNLTGITEFNDVLLKHFIDSLSSVMVIDYSSVSSVIDIGSGAGFPGIPLKIAFPYLNVCLLDSLNKRVNFLNDCISLLGLKNITAIHGRAETFARNPLYREKFDLSVSRAVANLSSLCEYCLPYVKIGGSFISYKSGAVAQEVESASHAINLLGGTLSNVKFFRLPGSDIDRSFVVVSKNIKTSLKFPRKEGIPVKDPL